MTVGVDMSGTSLGLYGLDRCGRSVSRGENDARRGLTHASGAFEVAVWPTGEQERFELVVLRTRERKPGD